jgi:quercetin dioxygenase-like cupin family protein
MDTDKNVEPEVVQLRTQLVREGHTRHLLAETNLMTLRIHCYAPGIGENALHSHTKEDHIFLVLQGTAQFNTGKDGKKVLQASKTKLSFFRLVAIISSATLVMLPS